MCVNFNFRPLVIDTKTNKKRIVFNFSLNLLEYNDLKKLHEFDLNFKLKFLNLKSLNLDEDEKFLKFVQVPCGHCSECLNVHAKGLAYRILKEAQVHDECYFLTLTYDDDHIPKGRSLVKEEISIFNKRLKNKLRYNGLKSDFRFYAIGEYGGKSLRPHYHVIYFGLPINDLKFYCFNEKKDPIYNSDFINSVWEKGFVTIENVGVGAAFYVARYCDKKKLRHVSSADWQKLNLVPEFSVMSRMPGIGASAYPEVVKAIFNQQYVLYYKNQSFPISKYYLDRFKKEYEFSPELLAFEKNTEMISDSKYSKYLLTYDKDYDHVIQSIEIDKIKNKNKRLLKKI